MRIAEAQDENGLGSFDRKKIYETEFRSKFDPLTDGLTSGHICNTMFFTVLGI